MSDLADAAPASDVSIWNGSNTTQFGDPVHLNRWRSRLPNSWQLHLGRGGSHTCLQMPNL